MVAAVLAAACSGPSANPPPTTATPSAGVEGASPGSATAGSPGATTRLPARRMSRDDAAGTPAAALQSIDDLIDADHPPVSAAAALDAVVRAFAADAAGSGDPGWTGGSLTGLFAVCQTGDPMATSDPAVVRATACARLILLLFQSYRSTGIAADDQAAIAVYGYGFTALSHVPVGSGGARDVWSAVVPALLRAAASP